MSRYEVLRVDMVSDREVNIGDIVYDCLLDDYGAVKMDNKRRMIPHSAVSRNRDGSYPFFTIPTKHLRKIE